MATTENDTLRMYLLMGVTDTSHPFLKDRYPNVTYVLVHPDPSTDLTANPPYNQDLFKGVNPAVYGAFHNYLKTLNGGSTIAPPVVEHTQLQNAYTAAGSLVSLADSAITTGLWLPGSQHPPSGTVAAWHGDLA